MECGVQAINNILKTIRVTILQTRSQDMGFINGRMVGFIEGTFRMIIEMDMENYLTAIHACTRDIGKMASKLIAIHNILPQKQLGQLQAFK